MGSVGTTMHYYSFPIAIGFQEVELPIELLNEPFASQDDGKRASKTSFVKRPDFLFRLIGNSAGCAIDGKIISLSGHHSPYSNQSREAPSLVSYQSTTSMACRLYMPSWSISMMLVSEAMLQLS